MSLNLERLLFELGHKAEVSQEISQDQSDKLAAEKQRTGLSGHSIFRMMSDPPQGLTMSIASHIVDGNVQTAEPSWVTAILDLYAEQPDTVIRPITQAEKDKLEQEHKRTQMGRSAILKRIKDLPEGLTVATALNMGISGLYKDKADPMWIKAMLDTYALQPDSNARPITSDELQNIMSEAERTGLKGPAIFARMASPPKGLTRSIASHIVSGKRKSVEAEWIETLLNEYKAAPDNKRVLITEEQKALLAQEWQRTGLTGKTIFPLISNPPKGMDSGTTDNILRGGSKTTFPGWVDLILEAYSNQPDAEFKVEYIEISDEEREKIWAERERTGISGFGLFKIMKNLPPGLTRHGVAAVLDAANKDIKKSAPAGAVQAILETYALQPDIPAEKQGLKPVRAADLKKLQSEAERTGIQGHGIFGLISASPIGLNAPMASQIVAGIKKNAKPAWITSLLDAYAQQPSMAAKDKLQEKSDKIRSEATRTALSGYVIFGYMTNPPKGFKVGVVSAIVENRRKTPVPEEWLDAILDEYAKQPDMEQDQTLDEAVVAEIRGHKKRTGLGAHKLFNLMADPPEGLNAKVMTGIIAGSRYSAKPAWVEAVLTTYRQQPDTKIQPISEADQTAIRRERNRTNTSPRSVFSAIEPKPEGLTLHITTAIISGEQKKTEPAFVRAILGAFKDLPTSELSMDELQIITEDEQAKVISEYNRTGIGHYAIWQLIEDCPKGFTHRMVESILDGRKTSIKPAHVKLLIETYEKQPDAAYRLEPASKEGMESLKAEAERTGLGGNALFKRIKGGAPAGLTWPIARELAAGRQKNADPRWIPFLLEAYSKQPTSTITDVTRDLVSLFASEVERTGVRPGSLFRQISNPPADLKVGKVTTIVTGKVQRAKQEHIDAILVTYADLPDKDNGPD